MCNAPINCLRLTVLISNEMDAYRHGACTDSCCFVLFKKLSNGTAHLLLLVLNLFDILNWMSSMVWVNPSFSVSFLCATCFPWYWCIIILFFIYGFCHQVCNFGLFIYLSVNNKTFFSIINWINVHELWKQVKTGIFLDQLITRLKLLCLFI